MDTRWILWHVDKISVNVSFCLLCRHTLFWLSTIKSRYDQLQNYNGQLSALTKWKLEFKALIKLYVSLNFDIFSILLNLNHKYMFSYNFVIRKILIVYILNTVPITPTYSALSSD